MSTNKQVHNFSIMLTDDIKDLLVQKNSPCVVSVNSVLCSLSAEQVVTWLRKEYGLIITVDYYFNCDDTPYLDEKTFEWMISWPSKRWDGSCGHGYKDTYEDALLEGIKRALELI